jgi:hypothetical protein
MERQIGATGRCVFDRDDGINYLHRAQVVCRRANDPEANCDITPVEGPSTGQPIRAGSVLPLPPGRRPRRRTIPETGVSECPPL